MKILSLLFLILLLGVNPAYGCELVVRFVSYPPLSYLDKTKQWQGVDIEIVKALLERVDCRYQVVSLAWVRSMDLLTKGKIDLMSSVSKTTERDKFSYFVGPIRNEQIVLASAATAPITIKHLRQFDTLGKPIAIQRGAFYGEMFATILAQTPNAKAHYLTLPNNTTKLSLLHRERVSGLIEEKLNIIHQLNNNQAFKGLTLHFETLHYSPVYFALSKQSIRPALFARLEKAFITMQQDGTLKTILSSTTSIKTAYAVPTKPLPM